VRALRFHPAHAHGGQGSGGLGNAMGVRFHVIVGSEEAAQEERLLVS
jgi:hypothetical protein